LHAKIDKIKRQIHPPHNLRFNHDLQLEDGTTKGEYQHTPEMRAESFKKIIITSREDPIYESGVEAAPICELIENAEPEKKMYLDGIPCLYDSPLTKYLKDRNKTIISADYLEINQ
jgi:hypothetical protein